MVNHPDPPSIEELHHVFMNEGVPLAVSAARKAIEEAGIEPQQIVSPCYPSQHGSTIGQNLFLICWVTLHANCGYV